MRIFGAIYAKKYEWQDIPVYSWFEDYDGRQDTLEAQEYILICPCELEFEELSNGQFRARQVDGLRKKKDALRETFLNESKQVEERIQNLLAITDESHER